MLHLTPQVGKSPNFNRKDIHLQRPVRLAGVKGLLRVGGGLFKGGGEGCLMGEGGFLGWPSFPPPLQKNKGGRGVC